VTVTNNGPDIADNVVLTDQLPATATLVSAKPSSGTCNGTTTVTFDLGNLADGASATVVVVVTTTAKGTLKNVVTVDADDSDTSARNNRDEELTVVTFANLTVQALTAPSAVLPGATIDIQDTTQNSGSVDANSVTVTRIYLSSDGRKDAGDIILDARTVPALAKKQSNTAVTPVTIPGGTALGRYFIIAMADDDAAVVETNERNQRSRRITVTRPDLRVSALHTPASVVAGANLAIQDTTRNDDLVDGGASTTKFYLSTDKLFDGGDVLLGSRAVPALGARATSKASTTVAIPAAEQTWKDPFSTRSASVFRA
jgi:subtilase family serine protease